MHDELLVEEQAFERIRRSRAKTWLIVLYVAAVLTVDGLASMRINTLIDWSVFNWGPDTVHAVVRTLRLPEALFSWLYTGPMQSFDWFKFIFWLIVPVIVSWRTLVWSAFSVRRWKKLDVVILGMIAFAGLFAMAAIVIVPELQATYPGVGSWPADQQRLFVLAQLAWMISWLPGWEFMHRYFLLDRVTLTWPFFGWLLLPIFEGAYHLQKPGIEAVAMVFFSVLLTRWAMKRANVLLPFCAHLIIEVELVLAMLLIL